MPIIIIYEILQFSISIIHIKEHPQHNINNLNLMKNLKEFGCYGNANTDTATMKRKTDFYYADITAYNILSTPDRII